MRMRAFVLVGLASALLWTWGPAYGQGNPTGKLSGRVTSGNGALPGVKVTVSSPNLQGTKSTTTTATGDYLFPSLPAGDYTVTFEREGLATEKQELKLAAAQSTTLDTEMAAAAVTEEIVVTGSLESISQTTQAATTYTKHLVDELPAGRTINQIVALSPGVQPNGPTKNTDTGLSNITISGAPTYENLFLLNGVVLNENIRGQAFDLYIEDAVQETTTATAGVSAEYGRFSGGVVNVVTKSGGNEFSGSFRATLNNQNWQEKTPLTTTQTNDTVPTYEGTLGGPVVHDRLWFFLAARARDQKQTLNTSVTNISYDDEDNQKRYEGKLTATINPQHSFTGAYSKVEDKENGNSFLTILDTASLVNRETPQKLWSINYTGVLTENLLLTGQYSQRNFTFIGSGADSTDIIAGTLLLDRSRGNARYHSATFCGVCEPEKRDNKNGLVKLSYFLSSPSLGSHDLVGGYDTFNDIRLSDNHQSGSDYRVFGTGAIIQGTQIYPVFNSDGTTIIQFNPILQLSKGTAFKTNSFFANDTWRVSEGVSLGLGLRYDSNNGTNGQGATVAKDSKLSPRLSATFDPTKNGNWVLHASYAQYVAALANSIGDSSSAGGVPANFQWAYRGPAINTVAGAPLVSQDDALRTLFNWFFTNGGPTGPLPLITVSIPGGNTQIRGSLDSPNVKEYTAGVTVRLGSHGLVRTDLVHRDWADFYSARTDLGTGRVQLVTGPSDLTLVVNNNSLYNRKYDGLHTAWRYQPTGRLDFGGTWTLSHTVGNFDGENAGSGPILGGLQNFPEYIQARWNSPKGDLAIDQRNRVSVYGLYKIFTGESHNELSVSVLQGFFSGHPYGAVGTVGVRAFVTNPGYVTPPVRETYYYTGRDAFRTPDVFRTDLSFNYAFRIGGLDLFVKPEVLNVFNSQRVDTTASTFFDTSVLTADNGGTCAHGGPGGTAGPCQPFNPFTTSPVEGVNWQKGPNFGKAINPFGFEQPRTYRVGLGLRF
ncbi:MAG: TonB-dependent receptor [Thermoanaerobaculia bacterium]